MWHCLRAPSGRPPQHGKCRSPDPCVHGGSPRGRGKREGGGAGLEPKWLRLRKPDGGVRGIATGDVFRRLVARTLAKEWAQVFDDATRPYQFALQARAGTDALAASVRAALSLRPGSVLVSLDGRSAYDSMSRVAFLSKLREVAPELLPFVRLFYGQPSSYCWWDATGACRTVPQGEGCEQSPCSGAVRAGATRGALPSRGQAAPRRCLAPPGISELGAAVWRGDKPPPERGLVVLGTPIGHPEFVRA